MGKLRLGWEVLKALPAAGLMEYLYKLGGEKKETKLKIQIYVLPFFFQIVNFYI